MMKSRELPFDRGLGDGYYWSMSSTVWKSSANFDEHMDLMTRCYIGLSNANVYRSVPAYVGNQTFSSSELPRPRMNNCENLRFEGVAYPITYCNEDYRVDNYYHAVPFYQPGVTGTPDDAIPPKPNWVDSVSASRRAWWSMQPRFEGEFSALNFLFELKDFKDVARHLAKLDLKRVVALAKAVKKKYRRAKKRASTSALATSRATVGAATDLAAAGVLTKNLMVDPTIMDLQNLHDQMLILVREAQDQFFRRGQKPQSTHYSEIIYENSTTGIATRNELWRMWGWIHKIIFTATMQYRYDYEYRSWFEALKRMYGLNWNASVVWNMLPLSFILDYVIKVGQAIDFMNIDPNVELRLMQYCESLLSKATSGTHFSGHAKANVLINGGIGGSKKNNYQPRTGQHIAGYSGTWYIRKVKSPNKGAAIPRLTVPSTKQAVNLVALLRAMW